MLPLPPGAPAVPAAGHGAEPTAVRGAEAGEAEPRRPARSEGSGRGAEGEAGVSSGVELAWKQLLPPAKPASRRGWRRGSPSPRRAPASPRLCAEIPSPPRPPASLTLLPREESFVCDISSPPLFATGLGRKGEAAAAGAGGGEGGSYLLLIYLFSSFLPQVAMVIQSSLSLRRREDGQPLREQPPVPSAPAALLPQRRPFPPCPSVGAGAALPPPHLSGSPLPGAGCPLRCPVQPSATPAPPSGAAPRWPPRGGARREQPKQPHYTPPFEVFPRRSAAGEGATGRDGATLVSPLTPARGCLLPSPGAWGPPRSPGQVRGGTALPEGAGPLLGRLPRRQLETGPLGPAASPPPPSPPCPLSAPRPPARRLPGGERLRPLAPRLHK